METYLCHFHTLPFTVAYLISFINAKPVTMYPKYFTLALCCAKKSFKVRKKCTYRTTKTKTCKANCLKKVIKKYFQGNNDPHF